MSAITIMGLKPKVFDGSGYLAWKKLMKVNLMAEGSMAIVEGVKVKPVISNPTSPDKDEAAALKDWVTHSGYEGDSSYMYDAGPGDSNECRFGQGKQGLVGFD
ncbi:hypothetical protein R1flu_026935 [Riccia fluitans]|uniref:Gag-pol polyprotein n=1 Tax=Riccia fluitans TaxID=41844 RepID=A0ABD1XHC2_9MARC